jgi:hypothetical protein
MRVKRNRGSSIVCEFTLSLEYVGGINYDKYEKYEFMQIWIDLNE